MKIIDWLMSFVPTKDERDVNEIVREWRDARVRVAFLESELAKYGYTAKSITDRFAVYKRALKAQVRAS